MMNSIFINIFIPYTINTLWSNIRHLKKSVIQKVFKKSAEYKLLKQRFFVLGVRLGLVLTHGLTYELTHSGPKTPYGDVDLGQNFPR